MMATYEMASPEDLAALFARNMSLQQQQQQQQQQIHPTIEPFVYSISQHYHHSAHALPSPPPRPASEPPQSEAPDHESLLASHSISPALLSTPQMTLFKTASPEQQERLIQLWRICPPNHVDVSGVTYTETSVAHEESIAQLRYEQSLMDERLSRTSGAGGGMMEDGMSDDANDPLTPLQASDGSWRSASVEPYMLSGYEALAAREYEESMQGYRGATDPVYNTPGSGAVFIQTGAHAGGAHGKTGHQIWAGGPGHNMAMVEDEEML